MNSFARFSEDPEFSDGDTVAVESLIRSWTNEEEEPLEDVVVPDADDDGGLGDDNVADDTDTNTGDVHVDVDINVGNSDGDETPEEAAALSELSAVYSAIATLKNMRNAFTSYGVSPIIVALENYDGALSKIVPSIPVPEAMQSSWSAHDNRTTAAVNGISTVLKTKFIPNATKLATSIRDQLAISGSRSAKARFNKIMADAASI